MKSKLFKSLFFAGLLMFTCSCGGGDSQSGENGSNDTPCTEQELADLSKTLGVSVTNDDDTKLFREVATWMDVPFKSAGADKNGADCSGFVDALYLTVYGVNLPRQTSKIYEQASSISLDNIHSGDLVFFRTDGKLNQTPNYLGVFLKEKRFAVMSSKGFRIESLESSYYKKNFVCAGRVK